ncbi:uncharacterized protein EDB93DRAFT_1335077 [Suillus bovinus]|uniref:uncharacterized protein n=1 Tax=Suillus bovinus TaxID=48563 RepID=UPI001B862A05|nr:uncharacterized protein EDB93DRAFT_1335077 [Suillus bovinus]KAG2157642.1 hypothetical protein EDB93DRAFT_1335077 [Suillus bovinus]
MASTFKTEMMKSTGIWSSYIVGLKVEELRCRTAVEEGEGHKVTPSGTSLLPPRRRRVRALGHVDLIQEHDWVVDIVEEEWRRDVEAGVRSLKNAEAVKFRMNITDLNASIKCSQCQPRAPCIRCFLHFYGRVCLNQWFYTVSKVWYVGVSVCQLDSSSEFTIFGVLIVFISRHITASSTTVSPGVLIMFFKAHTLRGIK